MAQALGIATCAGQVLGKVLINPVSNSIKKQYKYLFRYIKNIEKLGNELGTLERQRNGLQCLVDAAKRNDHIIDDNVLVWLGNVENIKGEADAILNVAVNSTMQCICLQCPNLKFRYCMGRKAVKITRVIVDLQKKGVFETVGYPKPPKEMLIKVPPDDQRFETRIKTKMEIVEALMDDDSFIIGICGMAGVGKTTMAHEIADEMKTFFDEVAIAVVSNNPDIKQIQDQIVQALGAKIEELDNEGVRAGRVHDRLTSDVDKKILIILDDVWEEVDLRKMGILPKGDQKGLKILLTSRRKAVFDIMGVNRVYTVEVLSESEAWKLFKDTANIADDTDETVKSIAVEATKECGGLPLSLVIIGKTMRNKDKETWMRERRKLQNSSIANIEGMHEHVYKAIGYSYDNLKNEDVKSLFLLCSLFPEDFDISVETLVRYAWGLHMFSEMTTLSEMRDGVISIVFHLKNNHLLLSGTRNNTVRLHDVVRDFALHIASQGPHVYMSKHNGLEEWPRHVNSNSYTAIALRLKSPVIELPSVLEYPRLKLLRLASGKIIKISDDFFSHMNQLRVLEFKSSEFEIPLLVQSLTNLQTLSFDNCDFEINISSIGTLKGLEILSFFGCQLSDFPIEIALLRNLKSLDLRCKIKKSPCRLPCGILSRLNKLEELYLGADSTWYDGAGDYKEEKENILAELSTLKTIRTFQICTYDQDFLMEMLKVMSLENLERFQIICGEGRDALVDYHFGRSLRLSLLEARMITKSAIYDLLLWRVDDLQLNGTGSFKNFVNELDEHGFADLKTLKLSHFSVEYLFDTTNLSARSAFTNLQKLELMSVSDLKGICNGNLPPGAFSRLQQVSLIRLPIQHLWRGVLEPPSLCNLEKFDMIRCDEIKSPFSESAGKCLLNLGGLTFTECKMLEHVVSRDAVENEITDEVLEFKKLRYAFFDWLPSFKSFRSQSSSSNADTNTLISQVTLPNLEYLDVSGLHSVAKILNDELQPKALYKLRKMSVDSCDGLTSIGQCDAIKALQNLEFLDVGRCETLLVLFALEGLKFTAEETWSVFDRLSSLKLNDLPKLEHVVRRVPQGVHTFQNLTSVQATDCNNLRYLFSPFVASSLSSLKTLKVGDCEKIEKIVGSEEEMAEPALIDRVVFSKLSTLKLGKLPSLKMFCCENIELVFPSLHKLVIVSCPVMEKFSSQEPIAPELKKIQITVDRFVDFSNVLDPGLLNVEEGPYAWTRVFY